MKKYHILYKTTNRKTGRYYIGIHSTDDLDDGYLGSGVALKKSIQYHGREIHEREILEYSVSREALFERESIIVNREMISDPLCMNRVSGGAGVSEKFFSSAWGNDDPDIQRARGSIANEKMKWLRENDTEWAEKYSENISSGLRLAYKEGRLERKPFYDFSGKTHTDEAKKAIGEKNSVHQKGEKNSQYGKVWIYKEDLKKNKKVDSIDMGSYLKSGWKLGLKMDFFNKDE